MKNVAASTLQAVGVLCFLAAVWSVWPMLAFGVLGVVFFFIGLSLEGR
jgi:hypothetical protein